MTTTTTHTRTTQSRSRRRAAARRLTPAARQCRERFLSFFPDGFRDEIYVETERGYKWDAHREWLALLNRDTYRSLIEAGEYEEIASRCLRLESRTNLLFSFEKMALRDALRTRSERGRSRSDCTTGSTGRGVSATASSGGAARWLRSRGARRGY